MRGRDKWTKDELIAALLDAPLPLLFIIDENSKKKDDEKYKDPDYKNWYEEYVIPLRKDLDGDD